MDENNRKMEPGQGTLQVTLAAGDVSGDGQNDIVFIDTSNNLKYYDVANSNVIDVGNQARSRAELSDVDNDGSEEIIFRDQSDNIRYTGKVTSGNALVSFNSGVPADIDSWDLATFQRTLDGETVTVDVEDDSGNVLFSDIGPNFDISTVDTSKNVTLRANLSRNDTANNPTLDYAARRFTR